MSPEKVTCSTLSTNLRMSPSFVIASLPPRFREAVVLRFVQELDYAEIAEVLKQPVGTVKSNVHRGIQLLRTQLEVRQL